MLHRYIEIFRSSLSEIQNVLGYQRRRSGGFNSRPGPYDRESRYGGGGGGGGGGRFQSRGSRSFKGANFSNNGPGTVSYYHICELFFTRFLLGYDTYDRPSPWANNSQNGGNKSLFSDSWGSSHDRGPSGLHCVHMRGLPFKATHNDISDVSRP